MKYKTNIIYRRAPISKQFMQLNIKHRLIIGTPGRIKSFRRNPYLYQKRFSCFDEMDRMLDMDLVCK